MYAKLFHVAISIQFSNLAVSKNFMAWSMTKMGFNIMNRNAVLCDLDKLMFYYKLCNSPAIIDVPCLYFDTDVFSLMSYRPLCLTEKLAAHSKKYAF